MILHNMIFQKELRADLFHVDLRKKTPIAVKVLTVLIKKLANVNSSLSDFRTATMVVLAFVDFFRFNEVRLIKRSDINFD